MEYASSNISPHIHSCYPASEVRGGGREDIPHALRPEARGGRREELPHTPTPEARGGGREDQTHTMAPWAQEGLEELSHVEGQEGRR